MTKYAHLDVLCYHVIFVSVFVLNIIHQFYYQRWHWCISSRVTLTPFLCRLSCLFRLNLRALRWSQAMIFFIDEINRNPVLLPNITLGYRIYDTCWTVALSTRTALSVVSQPLKRTNTGACSSPSIPLVIGDSGSSLSISVSRLLNLFKVPLVRASLCCSFRVKCSWMCTYRISDTCSAWIVSLRIFLPLLLLHFTLL